MFDWLSSLSGLFSHPTSRSGKRRHERRRPAFRRLCFESLEQRAVLNASFDSVLGVGNDSASILPWDNAVDAAGNAYVAGILYGELDFDPLVEQPDGSDILTPRGSSDAFIAKYAPDNSLVWARRMGSDFQNAGPNDPIEGSRRMAVDAAGSVYVSGEFSGQADFGQFTLTSAGNADGFVTKLDASGNFLWANRWGGATRENAGGVAVDTAGNVIAVGSTATVSENGSWTSNGFEIRKYSPTGSAVWSKRVNDWGGSAASVATDASGNVYLCGGFSGTVDFNPDPRKTAWVAGGSGQNGYVLKLTAAGGFGWVAPFVAKTSESASAYSDCRDIAIDGAGNVLVAGSYRGPVDFNPSPKFDYRLPNTYSYDGFVANLSSRGSLAWVTSLGGASVQSLAVDASGSVYVVGMFGPLFSPAAGVEVTSNGSLDVFVTKLTAAGNLDWYITFGGTGGDLGTGISVDAAGAVYVTGTYLRTVDFDPDPLATYELTNPAYADLFLLKLRSV